MSRNWEDLKPRVYSAIVMVAVGLAAIIIGGLVFDVLMLAVALLGLRELWQMLRPRLGNPFDVMILFGYGFAILAACLAFVIFRAGEGGIWAIFFLVAIVVTSDVMGYFAGRVIGGPKFWPRISPKKTWSGTIAGWAGAAIVGVLINHFSAADGAASGAEIPLIALVSALLAFAGQLGDIAQSAIKRRAGVKDSSNLIPGHGGILDRFDAMIGVGMIVAILILLNGG